MMIRSLYLGLACVVALVSSTVVQAADYTRPKVRAITAFVRLNPTTYATQISDALIVLRAAQSEFANEGYETETLRIVTQPLADLVQGQSETQALAYLRTLMIWGARRTSCPISGRP
jgi:hypothetical protein